ncbi:hypothetical protein GWK08_06675 [Leptobacterium flavescens]|uniref:DoxX family protein n=1 Tax=Leptobacterium flavescens TaxID=472055 RepID=A0A6P0URV9_9FLAO|nr:hypothetical protein [Leptobacterium flavescens]NER13116.1 hypothetical protein [Leptobacterium flavescens]
MIQEYTWNKLVPWFGNTILGIEGEISMNGRGSGDTTADYIQVLIMILISLLAALIWTILDRKRPSYNKLMKWGVIYVRYVLAYFMFVYGFVKVIKLQFSSPTLFRLLEPLGDFSPMGLAWTYMGYSDTYTFFAGACEVLAGLLLLFRRTQILGGLVAMGTMFNIFMMNMSYDIPVKLLSFHLFAFSVLIVCTDYKRLLNVFLLNKATEARKEEKLFKKARNNKIALGVKVLFVGYILFSLISSDIESMYQYGTKAPKPALYGIYDVEEFIINKDTLPPLMTDTIRWRKVVLNYEGSISIKKMDDSKRRYYGYRLSLDTTKHKMKLTSYRDSTDIIDLNYRKTDSINYVLNGIMSNSSGIDTLEIRMKRFDEKQFRLLSRGFNWINETPYNR